jgi:transcriptional regulator of arginine metabolism
VKAVRHRRIAALLRSTVVGSQAELAALLRKQGERVTQATLSRDLEELGAFKTRLTDGRTAYRLPEEPPPNGEHLRRMLNEFVTGVEHSGSMVVLRTPPGCAQPVARAIDTGALKDIIGTVAGDDTILVVCREGVTGRTVARRIEAMAAGDTAAGKAVTKGA